MIIEKLKDDLSNVMYSYNITNNKCFRDSVSLHDRQYLKTDTELEEEQQALINSGYAKIINDVFYCSKPNYYQQYIIDSLGW